MCQERGFLEIRTFLLIKDVNLRALKIENNIIKNEIGALIYSGSQAKENFLIDDVLDFDELIKITIKNKKFENYKLLEMQTKNNFLLSYLKNYININYSNLCNNLNSTFISVFPIFLNNC